MPSAVSKTTIPARSRRPAATLLAWLARLYLLLLFAWLLLYSISGDRLNPLAAVNMLAVYLFFPLPLAALLGWLVGRRDIWAAAGLGAAAFLWLWGWLFVPARAPAPPAGKPVLRVLTYNVLGYQLDPDPQIAVLLQENADLVFLQELNPELAQALRQKLAAIYPYQALDPQPGVHGMGVLSKYPLQPALAAASPLEALDWVGRPQVLLLDWLGQPVTLVNFHMIPTTLGSLPVIGQQSRYRQAQAQALAQLAAQTGPLIAAGDANTTPTSQAYRLLASSLEDAWVSAGLGLGHTFPGSDAPGSSRPRLSGFPVPMWLARIDYIFTSSHWQVYSAHNTIFDGVSDHRGVAADLYLRR